MKKSSLFIFIVFCILTISFVGQNQKMYAYLFDNARFTEKHCINKNNPEKQCNGACQMKDNQENDEPATPSQPDYRSIDVFVADAFLYHVPLAQFTVKKDHYSQLFMLLTKKEKIPVPPPNA